MRSRSILTIVIHAVCWLLFLSLPLVFIGGTDADKIFDLISSPEYWFFCFAYILLFYLVANMLIPFFFLRKRYLLFSISIILLLIGIIALSPFDRLMQANRPSTFRSGQPGDFGFRGPGRGPGGPGDQFPGNEDRIDRPIPPPRDHAFPEQRSDRFRPQGRAPGSRHVDIVGIFMFMVVVALGMTIRISRQWRLSEQRATKAEAGKAQAELSFLKAQINPHFLFNTLNNLYVLALTRSPNTAESIMRLSNIMRYVTDEAGREWVPVRDEINCINDYLELQRLRIGGQTEIVFEVAEGAKDGRMAPLILMTFVENAFKYGVSAHHASKIEIRLRRKDANLNFSCSNTVFQSSEHEERSGVGIMNARQRLDYLYGSRHQLDIEQANNIFNVELVIPFLQND